jgi:hypothetical protein
MNKTILVFLTDFIVVVNLIMYFVCLIISNQYVILILSSFVILNYSKKWFIARRNYINCVG